MRTAIGQSPPAIVECIEDPARFTDLRDEWNQLLAASPANCLFLTWEWLHTWWKHLAGRRQLHLLLVRCGQELVAIAPLARRPPSMTRLLPFPALEFLGTGTVGSDYLDVIVRRGAERKVADALAGALADPPPAIELAQVNRESSFAAQLARRLEQKEWSVKDTPTDVCPFINLADVSWEMYLQKLGPAHRYNFRRRLKNLQMRFDVRCHVVQTEAQRGSALRVLIALHTRRWDKRGGSETFATPGLLAFYDEMSRLALERGYLRFLILRIDDEPAAVLHGYRYGACFSFYQMAFDPAFAKESVGLVLLGLSIRQALKEGALEYDFLHGAEPYKFLWTAEMRRLGRFELFPPDTRGKICRRVATASRHVRRAARRLVGNSIAQRILNRGWSGLWNPAPR